MNYACVTTPCAPSLTVKQQQPRPLVLHEVRLQQTRGIGALPKDLAHVLRHQLNKRKIKDTRPVSNTQLVVKEQAPETHADKVCTKGEGMLICLPGSGFRFFEPAWLMPLQLRQLRDSGL